jgi:PAS domain S-box-containing protein
MIMPEVSERPLNEERDVQRELEQRNQMLQALNDLAVRLLRINTTQEVYAAALDGILPIMGAKAGAMARADDARREWRMVAQHHYPEALLREARVLSYDTPAALNTARLSRDLVIVHPNANAAFTQTVLTQLHAQTGVVMPLAQGDAIVGMLIYALAEHRDCTPLEREILRTAATYVSAALERAQLYEQAEAERVRLARILDHLPMGVYIAEGEAEQRTMRWIQINPAGQEQLAAPSVTPGAVSETYRLVRLDGTPYSDDELPLQRALWEGQPVPDEEILFRYHTGEERVVLTTSIVLNERNGTREAIVVGQDITARKRAEQQLEQRVQQLESLYQLSEAATRAESVEAIYEAALDALQKTLGADRAAVLLFDDRAVMRFKAWRALSEGYRQVAQGHSPWTADAIDPDPVFVADVDEEPTLAGLRPTIRGEGIRALGFIPLVTQGRLLGKFMIYYNTPHLFTADESQLAQTIASQVAFATERKQAETAHAGLLAELQRQQQRLDTIVATVPGVVWEAWGRPDEDAQQINFVSSYVETMLGYSVAEWLATPNFWLTIVHPDDKEAAARVAAETFANGEGGVNRFRWVRKDGQAIWVEARDVVIHGADGTPLGMRGVTMDITERHELERQKDEFLSIASHELKTPITTIKGYAQSGLRSLRDSGDERITRTLRIINEQADRLTRLINELLDDSRIQNGTLPLYREPFDLADLVREVVSNMQLATPEFALILDCTAAPVNADRQRIEQVVLNLVQNAIKYSGTHRQVEITLRPAGAEVIAAIRDSGVGIPLAQQAHVFERFFRASNVESRHYTGLGLGLFISHSIILRHGGRMWLESAEGAGSTYYFSLPLTTPDEEAPPAQG